MSIFGIEQIQGKLIFDSYPFPRNFYAQNTIEFITVYVKDGPSENNLPKHIKEKSKLSEKEWVEFTKQIWNIPVPNKGDLAFGEHSAIMPEEIVRRCVRLFTYVGDTVLDPCVGSGTTVLQSIHEQAVILNSFTNKRRAVLGSWNFFWI